MSRPSLWFVVPAHGRVELARVCLRQLARTCQELTDNGLDAAAVVVASDENLVSAWECGFGTVERDNTPLGRKWNDGYELAGRAGVDYVVPLGTDDWVDPQLLLAAELPVGEEMLCFRRSAVVREDGRRLARLHITYDGGDGVRVIPTSLIRPLRCRPAEEDRNRAIDTSVMRRISNHLGGRLPHIRYGDLHPLQIVDWKSPGDQLNSYTACQTFREGVEIRDPFAAVAAHFPVAAVEEMRGVYGLAPVEAVAA